MVKPIWIVLALFIGAHAFAEDIEVPEEELARESTLPVFHKRRAVLNRSVLTEKRFEVGLGGGFQMNEPYYNNYMFGGQATYNYDDTSALNVQGLFWLPGMSSYGNQLNTPPDPKAVSPHRQFDASKAPHPQWAVIANYEYIAYYGKISVTKQGVMNLNTFGLAGIGYLNMGAISTAALNLGLGQNFFITNNIGLRWDLRWLIFQGPDATSHNLGPTDKPSAGDFSNRMFYNNQLDLGLVFIL